MKTLKSRILLLRQRNEGTQLEVVKALKAVKDLKALKDLRRGKRGIKRRRRKKRLDAADCAASEFFTVTEFLNFASITTTT